MEYIEDWIQQKRQDKLCKNAKINWTKGRSEMDTALPWHLLNWKGRNAMYIWVRFENPMARAGVHFSFDVLLSWADQGSRAHKCVC